MSDSCPRCGDECMFLADMDTHSVCPACVRDMLLEKAIGVQVGAELWPLELHRSVFAMYDAVIEQTADDQ